MALINCPECSKSISDQSISCINCGFPISNNPTFRTTPPPIQTKNSINNETRQLDRKPQVNRPSHRDGFSLRNLSALVILIGGLAVVFIVFDDSIGKNSTRTAVTPTTHQVDMEETQRNYEHYIGGTFANIRSCMSFIENEARKEGMELSMSGDSPEKITGSFNGNAEMFFYCEKKETGTKGTFYEAAWPKFK
jgi:hypothetical protein